MIILTAGEFGFQVGALLAKRHSAVTHEVTAAGIDLESALSFADFVAVALWRPYVCICEQVDDICQRRGIRWSLTEIVGDKLHCGPLIVPGMGPCYRCYRKRYLSHHTAPDREMTLHGAYERDPRCGVPGHIYPMAVTAAGALSSDLAAEHSNAGRLRVVELLGGGVLEVTVLGVHGCPVCGAQRGAAVGARYVDRLIPQIKELLDDVR
jgi:bacteriocin biosynthesis cyclodehydratase domain-containing protein